MNILKELQKICIQFRDDRDWGQFHDPLSLVQSISIESAELLELFQWGKSPNNDDISDEIADIFIYIMTLAHECDIDIGTAILTKISKNEKKYPISKFRGSNKKYNGK